MKIISASYSVDVQKMACSLMVSKSYHYMW